MYERRSLLLRSFQVARVAVDRRNPNHSPQQVHDLSAAAFAVPHLTAHHWNLGTRRFGFIRHHQSSQGRRTGPRRRPDRRPRERRATAGESPALRLENVLGWFMTFDLHISYTHKSGLSTQFRRNWQFIF